MSAVSVLTGVRMADVWRFSKTSIFRFLLGVALCTRKIIVVIRSFITESHLLFHFLYSEYESFRDLVAKISESRVAYIYTTRADSKVKDMKIRELKSENSVLQFYYNFSHKCLAAELLPAFIFYDTETFHRAGVLEKKEPVSSMKLTLGYQIFGS